MNPPVITQFALPDPNAVVLNLTQLFQLGNTLLQSEIQGDYIPYVISGTVPGVDDRDKVWIHIDSQGRPIAIKTWFEGHWRRVYNGMIGEVRGYNGNPNIDFDNNGKGKLGETYDGWHLCNGKDGTPNFTDKFLVAAHLDNSGGHSGYSGGWQTFVDERSVKKTGGDKDITLTAENTYQPPIERLNVGKWEADGNDRDESGQMYGQRSNISANLNVDLIEGNQGVQHPTAIPTLPPFLALGWIIFIGY